MSVVNYQRYVAGVERRRALLRQTLEQANTLRHEAHLPVHNVEHVVAEQEPLLSKQEFDSRTKAQKGFARFRQKQFRAMELPDPGTATNWQQHRALAFRRAFLEQQIQGIWWDRVHAHISGKSAR